MTGFLTELKFNLQVIKDHSLNKKTIEGNTYSLLGIYT